jgi:hypothetical protein
MFEFIYPFLDNDVIYKCQEVINIQIIIIITETTTMIIMRSYNIYVGVKETSRHLCHPKVPYCVHKSTLLDSILSHTIRPHPHTLSLGLRTYLILYFHLRPSLQNGLPSCDFPNTILLIFPFSHMQATCLNGFTLLVISIWRKSTDCESRDYEIFLSFLLLPLP